MAYDPVLSRNRPNNGAAQVQSLAEIRPRIVCISLSWGGAPRAPRTHQLYRRNAYSEQLEHRRSLLDRKSTFEAALHRHIGVQDALAMQRALNLLTGMGIDV